MIVNVAVAYVQATGDWGVYFLKFAVLLFVALGFLIGGILFATYVNGKFLAKIKFPVWGGLIFKIGMFFVVKFAFVGYLFWVLAVGTLVIICFALPVEFAKKIIFAPTPWWWLSLAATVVMFMTVVKCIVGLIFMYAPEWMNIVAYIVGGVNWIIDKIWDDAGWNHFIKQWVVIGIFGLAFSEIFISLIALARCWKFGWLYIFLFMFPTGILMGRIGLLLRRRGWIV